MSAVLKAMLVLAIQDVSVFDSASGVLKPHCTVLVEGERIKAVGPATLPLPPRAMILNGKVKYLIPGLVDAHVHLVHRLNFAHVTADEILPLFLAHGVTSVRDTGDELYG